jgi:hypothetical protein
VRIVANVKNSFLIATSKFILREFCGEVLGGECSPPPKKKKPKTPGFPSKESFKKIYMIRFFFLDT